MSAITEQIQWDRKKGRRGQSLNNYKIQNNKEAIVQQQVWVVICMLYVLMFELVTYYWFCVASTMVKSKLRERRK